MIISILVSSLVCLSSCNHDGKEPARPGGSEAVSPETRMATTFAADVLDTYYLWKNETAKERQHLYPDTCNFPIAVVDRIRYRKNGKLVDRWTALTDDIKSFTNSVEGLGLTFGYELQYGQITNKTGEYFLIVCYVCKDGPAEKAGLKRGDIILTMNGKAITASNIDDAFNAASYTAGICNVEVDQSGGLRLGEVTKTVDLVAKDMYEDPILLSRTFDVDGKKVGYFVYNGFDRRSMQTLPDVFRGFKAEGIGELVIDLRYNGGGYAMTETELASMIAPPSAVAAKEVFQTEVYNSVLSEVWKNRGLDTRTRFSGRHVYSIEGKDTTYIDVSDANPGVSRVWAIVTGGSASASEGLIVGLKPFMELKNVGEKTYGKYCAGYMLDPSVYNEDGSDVVDEKHALIKNWGIYVMVSKFADKNGKNDAEPDGMEPDIRADDNPFDGYQLGDPEETMLKATLDAIAGKKPTKTSRARHPAMDLKILEHGPERGLLIKEGKLPPIN